VAKPDTSQTPEDQNAQTLSRCQWLLQSHEMGGDVHGFPLPDRFQICDDDIMNLNSDRCTARDGTSSSLGTLQVGEMVTFSSAVGLRRNADWPVPQEDTVLLPPI